MRNALTGYRFCHYGGQQPDTRRFQERFKTRKFSEITSVVVDMFQSKIYKRVLQNLSKEHQVDVVVDNAFSFGRSNVETGLEGDLESLSDEQWENAFHAGVGWAIQTIRPFLSSMEERRAGSIINICSMYSLVAPNPKFYRGEWLKYLSQPTYTTVKTRLLDLTRHLASFLAEHNIRCNAIAPGAFSKPSTDKRFIEMVEGAIPLGRIGKPEDLVGALVYLPSDNSFHMTGHCLSIDGGLTVR